LPAGVFLKARDDPPAFLALDEAGILTCLSRSGKPVCSCLALPPHSRSALPSAGGIASLSLLHAPEAGTAVHSGVFVTTTSQTGRVVALRLVDLASCELGEAALDGPPAMALLPLPPAFLVNADGEGAESMAMVPRGNPSPVVVTCIPATAGSVDVGLSARSENLGAIVHVVATPGTGMACAVACATSLLVGTAASSPGMRSSAVVIPLHSAADVPPASVPSPVVESADGTDAPTLPDVAVEAPVVIRSAPVAVAHVPTTAQCPVGAGPGAAAPAAWTGCPALVTGAGGEVVLLDGGLVVATAAIAPAIGDPLVSAPAFSLFDAAGAFDGDVCGLCAAVLPSPADGGLLLAVGCSDRTLRTFEVTPAELAGGMAAARDARPPLLLRQTAVVPLPGLPGAVTAAADAGVFVVSTGVLGVPTAGTVVFVRPRPGATHAAATEAFTSSAPEPAPSASAGGGRAGGFMTGGSTAVDRFARVVVGARIASLAMLKRSIEHRRQAAEVEARSASSTPEQKDALLARQVRPLRRIAETFGLDTASEARDQAIDIVMRELGQQSIPALPASAVPVHAAWPDRFLFGPAAALSRILKREAAGRTEAVSTAAAAAAASSSSSSGPRAAGARGSGADDDEAVADAAAADDPAWKDRVALFSDSSKEAGCAVVVVARWLPHRGGWVEVSRYAAAEGSTLGLSAAEDGTTAAISASVPGAGGAKPYPIHGLHLVDLASPADAVFDQICDEFGLIKTGSSGEFIRVRVQQAMIEGGVGDGAVSARPMATLEAAGARLSGDERQLEAATFAAKTAARDSFRQRQGARVAVGRQERFVGSHSRRSKFDAARWHPAVHAEFPAQRFEVPDGTLEPRDYEAAQNELDRPATVAFRAMEKWAPLPRLLAWAGKVKGKLDALPEAIKGRSQRLAARLHEHAHDSAWEPTEGEVALLTQLAMEPAADGKGCALLMDAIRKESVRRELGKPPPTDARSAAPPAAPPGAAAPPVEAAPPAEAAPKPTPPRAVPLLKQLAAKAADLEASGRVRMWAVMALPYFFAGAPTADLAMGVMDTLFPAALTVDLPGKLALQVDESIKDLVQLVARQALAMAKATPPRIDDAKLPPQLFDSAFGLADKAIYATIGHVEAAPGAGAPPAAAAAAAAGSAAAPPTPEVVAESVRQARAWVAVLQALLVAGVWPKAGTAQTAAEARELVLQAMLRMRDDGITQIALVVPLA